MPTPNYSAALLARIDEHAEALTPAQRQVFLREQHIHWSNRFEHWMQLVDDIERARKYGNAVAVDFHLVMTGISKRLAREQEAA